MNIHLELGEDGPLQQRLARAIETAIRSGRLRAGACLPTSRELARELGIARNTATLALDEVIARGLAQPRARRGVFVNDLGPGTAEPLVLPAGEDPPRLSRRAQALLAATPAVTEPALRHELDYGQPLVSPALLHAWRQALGRAAERMSPNYPDPVGLRTLREGIASMLIARRGLRVHVDDVIVVTGAQQAFDLVAAVLVDPGDAVAVEDPQYEGMRTALAAVGARFHPCAVDGDGMVVAQLPAEGARLACVTPSHQFPTGALLSTPRREALLAWAAQHAAWVVEDDYDGEFRYGAAPAPALHSLAGGERVIHVGTFSKMLFPALRLAYVVVPPALRAAFAAAKRSADRGSSVVEQMAVADLLESGAIDRHLRRLTRELDRRRHALVDALARGGRGSIVLEGINAGMHVVARIPSVPWTRYAEFSAQARGRGLRLEPVRPHFLAPAPMVSVLLGYSAAPPAALVEVAHLLCRAVAAMQSSAEPSGA